MDSNESLEELLRNWNTTLPATLGYGHLNVSDIEDITRSINEFYFGNETTPTYPVDIQALMNVSRRMDRLDAQSLFVGFYRQVSCIHRNSREKIGRNQPEEHLPLHIHS